MHALPARTPCGRHLYVFFLSRARTDDCVLGAAPGWQNWNGFQMRFNGSLLLNTAKALQANGLFDKGYNLIQYGGASYPHQGLAPLWNSTNSSNRKYVIVRNSTGHYQIDPGKFRGPGSSDECLDDERFIACMISTSPPGATNQWTGDPERCGCRNGNGAVAALSAELHAMGFGFGSYSGESRCFLPNLRWASHTDPCTLLTYRVNAAVRWRRATCRRSTRASFAPSSTRIST